MHRIIFVLSILLLFGCSSIEKEVPLKILLTDNWQFKGIDTLDWKNATVPGNIFTDLLKHKIIEDPFVKRPKKLVIIRMSFLSSTQQIAAYTGIIHFSV